ncbi:MAG TPA: HepT-like ribonuclease domain-containing protein [Ktedonobacteraceae bacterium]
MRDPIEQLHRIQNAIIKITEYAKKGRRKFDTEEEIQLSAIYYLQTIGEAANAIPQSFKDHHPEIPWKQLGDFQSLITHYYLEIDKDGLWHIVVNDLPTLEYKAHTALEETQKQASRNKHKQPLRKSAIAKPYAELLKAKRDEILRTAIKHGASNVRIFGSVARGEADVASDIDLLVDVEPGRTLFDLSELIFDLQELLGHDVDLVTEKGLHNRIRERVLKEAIPL